MTLKPHAPLIKEHIAHWDKRRNYHHI